jgi:hypothetical protein
LKTQTAFETKTNTSEGNPEMTITRQALILTLTVLGTIAAATTDAQAGGCSSGRSYYRAPSHGHQYHSHYQTNYHTTRRVYSTPQTHLHQGVPTRLQFGPPAPSVIGQQPASLAPRSAFGQLGAQQTQLGGQQQVQPLGGSPQQTQPSIQQTQPQQTQPNIQQTQPQQQPSANAEQSALRALAGMMAPQPQSQPQTQPQAQPTVPSHVGTWTAKLPNQATVALTLDATGAFRWIATTKGGQQSSFGGSYQVGSGSLKLSREGDSQALDGQMKLNGTNAFNFKIGGSTDSGLNFVRG